MLPLLLAGALLAQSSTVPAPIRPRVGGFVLLTNGAPTLPDGQARLPPVLTDAHGQLVPRGPWLNRPLKVLRETASAYLLAQGPAQAWLPKNLLASKSVFPLLQTANTQALARELGRATVRVNGQPNFPCEVTTGYHALVTLKTARVASVWMVVGDHLNLSPQGGAASGDSGPNERGGPQAVLVMLDALSGVRFTGAGLEENLVQQSTKLMAQVPQRCTSLAALFANTDDLHRTLSTARPVKVPGLPDNPDAQQQALVGWTKAQVLAQYGSPNEVGSLQTILKLKTWSYGADAYSTVRFTFGPDGRVMTAYVGRSP